MTRFYFIPDDYAPSDKTMDAAKSLGLTEKQVFDQLDKCKDRQYKRPMIDPDRCFRNWLRNAIKFGDVVPVAQREYRQPEQQTEEQRRIDAEKAKEQFRKYGIKGV
jgi:hypothetical protein